MLYHRLIVCLVFLRAVRRMSLDSWALGSRGPGPVPPADELFFLKNQRRPREEIQSYSHNRKSDLPLTRTLPIVRDLAYCSFFLSLKPRCQGRVMSFVGGGCNVVISTAIPHHFFVYRIVNIK